MVDARPLLVVATVALALDAHGDVVLPIKFAGLGDGEPTVAATVFGRPARLVVDTGSTRNVVASRLARRAGLDTDQAEPIAWDALHRPIRGFPVDRQNALLAGYGPVADELFVSSFSDDMARVGRQSVGTFHDDGVLSPWQLAREGHALLLDFPRGQMVITTWERAQERVNARGAYLAVVGADADGKFVVEATACGQPARLEIDTGAESTILFQRRAPELTEGAVGARTTRTSLRVGGVTEQLSVLLLEPLAQGPRPDRDGLLGMDVLRHCRVALDETRLIASCDVPTTTAHDPIPRERAPVCDTRGPRYEIAGGGPVMVRHVDGSRTIRGRSFVATIARDGSLTIKHPMVRTRAGGLRPRDLPIELRDDDRSEERWFREETLGMRIELMQEEARRYADRSIDGLPELLDAIWGERRSARDRRRLLFELWDDAVEPDDPELGVAGARARAVIAGYVRGHLPAGSADGFTVEELTRFNARRPAGMPRFTPYELPPATPPSEIDAQRE
jgi:hypothetical protein